MSDQAGSTMGEAFAKIGVKSADQRLSDLALSAMVANAADTLEAIEQVWLAVQKDPALLVALFNPYGEYRGAIGRVFHRLKTEIAIANSRGTKLDTRQKKIMKIVSAEREEEKREQEEQRRIDREEQSRKDQEYREYLASWHKTPLWNMTVGDKPIWQVSAGTIRAWLPTQHKKLRAIEMLIEGVPEDGRALEYYRRPEDVKEIWRILGGSEDEGRA